MRLFWMLFAVAITAGIVHAEEPAKKSDEPAKKADDTAKAAGVAIDATDKAALDANMDKDVVVTGTIKKSAWSASGKVMNIEFDKSPLLAVVFVKNKEAIDKAFDGDAAKKWSGAKVKITGKLQKYGGKSKALEGKPQIIITKPDQVVVEELKKE